MPYQWAGSSGKGRRPLPFPHIPSPELIPVNDTYL